MNLYFVKHISEEYTQWMKSYYQCLLQFEWANLFVQTFTIWIFYGLTKREKIPDYADLSFEESEENEVERISCLETDVKAI